MLIQRGGLHLYNRVWDTVPYYTAHVAQEVNVYLPSSGAPPFPVVLFVHGGGWNSGQNSINSTHPARYFLQNGCAVVSVEYRLSPVAAWPAQSYDVKAAIRWVRANGYRYHLNAYRMGLFGYSAGAHLAVLSALSPDVAVLRDATMGNGSVPEYVRGVVGWATPNYFPDNDAYLALNGFPTRTCGTTSNESFLLGGSATPIDPCGGTGLTLSTQAAPVTYVSASGCPVRLEHGDLDQTIAYQCAQDLATALTNAGRSVVFTRHAALDHSTIFSDATVQTTSLGWLLTQITS